MSKFVHLRTHSEYSLLEALPNIKDLVKKAKKEGMPALALTDTGNLYGAIQFYKECKANEIKPIIGVDFKSSDLNLLLLAENELGYKNLLKLVTAINLTGFDKKHLEEHKEGLIAIGKEEKKFKEIFGKNFFLEDSLAIYDVRYLSPDDRPILDTVLAIQGQSRTVFEEGDFHFRTKKEALADYKDNPDALKRTLEIAERCNLELELGKWVFPDIETEDGLTPDEKLKEIVYAGFARRGLKKTKEEIERVEYELKVIRDKGYAKYFLVVWDLLNFAHEHGILTNIRGSVAGSLVTYLAGITNVNPLEYLLPFERFLNPDRPSAPDIDMDFADNRRDEVIEYARQKYGKDHVAQIGTFGTMMARGAVRDITRALGFPYGLGDKIAKLIPFGAQGFPMTIDRAMKENPDLKKLYEEDHETKIILDTAKKIEGNARHISVHAAGVVISPEPLVEYTALQYDTKGEGKIITQFDMYSIEEAGLLKFDFLGIRNLSIIADALERIKKIEGKEMKFEEIPLDDKKTFEMLARGETEGTFQLNGSGMTKALMELKPTSIHDINVMVALYRPGPMDNINEYIARKHGKKPTTFMHPKMKDFLGTTYGVLVYQDDLLMTAIEVAGYSWGEVDKFRKAVGKKIPEEMKKQHTLFVEGCQKHGGMTKEKAEALWELFVPFQGYGFNKAHAASYGHIAYITAYLKANFPAIYMSAVLTAESGDIDTIGVMIKECKRMGIEVLPPSINESFSQFSVIKSNQDPNLKGAPGAEFGFPYKIRFGLTTIKNFGQDVSTAITQERKENGKFKNLEDFLSRIKSKNLNKKSLEALIKSGALDEFEERGKLLGNLENLLSYHKEHMNAPANQDSLFGSFPTSSLSALRLQEAPPAELKDKLSWEKELLGLYISGHPLEAHKEKLLKLQTSIDKLPTLHEGDVAVIAGLVESARDVLTRGNERMVFMKLADLSGSTEVAVFPRVLSEFRQFVQKDACIAIKGKVSKRKGETSFVAEKIKAL